MYLVYLLPLFLIVVVALAIFTGPILAVVVFVLFLIAIGAYKFLGRGTDPEHASGEATPLSNAPGGTSTAQPSPEEDTGLWGERWPEQRTGEEPSP